MVPLDSAAGIAVEADQSAIADSRQPSPRPMRERVVSRYKMVPLGLLLGECSAQRGNALIDVGGQLLRIRTGITLLYH